jgi:hypothetical protein
MITIQPIGGLCNYLRVVFSYYEYAKSINTQLHVIWRKTDMCNGHFLDYFEPLPNVHMIDSTDKNTGIQYTGCNIHPGFQPNYSNLKLLPHMKELIKNRITILEKNYISVHIRRTDHIELAKKVQVYTDDNDFINFIDNFNNKNIYIATDNEGTYTIFKDKYPCLVKFDYHKTVHNSFRHTSLDDAIIDIYMCVFSDDFMGSGWSSFTDIILNLRGHKDSIEL